MSATTAGTAPPVAPVGAPYADTAGDRQAGYVADPVQRPSRIGYIIGLFVILLFALGAWWFLSQRESGADSAVARGVAHLQAGRREAARGEFSKAARDNPESARPHIFLARMAREERDFQTARRELDAAIRKEPENPVAHREMGALLFSIGNYDLARSFYIRSLRGDPDDRSAMGYLGCSLARLGRMQEAANWIQRAGQGPWSNCLNVLAPGQAPRTS